MNNDLSKMMCLDVYLNSLSKEEYAKIKHLLKPSESQKPPLKSWGVFSDHYQKTGSSLKRISDIKEVKKLGLKLEWKNDLDAIFSNESFEALVITDATKKIIWVNDGFSEMTGYSKKYAMNQRPKFLQGAGTSEKVKYKIREKIASNEPFKQVITNYKKDKTPYQCELKVFPLFGPNSTHYIALEKQVI